jgi:plastocyanin
MKIDRYILIAAVASCALLACGDDDTVTVVDAGPDSGVQHDAGIHKDAGANKDAGAKDAGVKHDAGRDAAAETDAGEEDAGASTNGLTIPTSVKKVTIVAVEFKLTPNQIKANRSEALLITLRNDGTVPHSIRFVLPNGNKQLKNTVAPGHTATLMFVAPSVAGSYDYYCPIDNHRALGMAGKLIVQ